MTISQQKPFLPGVLLPSFVLVTLAIYTYMYLGAPLDTSRPEGTSKVVSPPPSPRGLSGRFARLWEDPLANPQSRRAPSGLADEFAKFMNSKTAEDQEYEQLCTVRSYFESIVESPSGKPFLCMPVMIPGSPYADDKKRIHVKIIGPASSNTLHSMATESANWTTWKRTPKYRNDAEFNLSVYESVRQEGFRAYGGNTTLYSPRATVAARSLTRDKRKAMEGFLRSTEAQARRQGAGLSVVRTIGDVFDLVYALRDEHLGKHALFNFDDPWGQRERAGARVDSKQPLRDRLKRDRHRFLSPLIYEIANGRAYQLTMPGIHSADQLQAWRTSSNGLMAGDVSAFIHPPSPRQAQWWTATRRKHIALAVALIAICLAVNVRFVREVLTGKYCVLTYLTVFGLSLWLGPGFISDQQDPDGEPFTMLDGVSVWPTTFLCCAASLICILFIAHAFDDLRRNLSALSQQYFGQGNEDETSLLGRIQEVVKAGQYKAVVARARKWMRCCSNRVKSKSH